MLLENSSRSWGEQKYKELKKLQRDIDMSIAIYKYVYTSIYVYIRIYIMYLYLYPSSSTFFSPVLAMGWVRVYCLSRMISAAKETPAGPLRPAVSGRSRGDDTNLSGARLGTGNPAA